MHWVRVNYKNAQKGIDYTPIYLERFLGESVIGRPMGLAQSLSSYYSSR